MAFVRYKRVNNKKYYQLVRNYRENGKHKQEILYHLGPNHTSLEEAILDAQVQVALHRRKAAEWREVKETLKLHIIDKLQSLEGRGFLLYLHRIIRSYVEDKDIEEIPEKFKASDKLPDLKVASMAFKGLKAYRNFLSSHIGDPRAVDEYDKWAKTQEEKGYLVHIYSAWRANLLDYHFYYEYGNYELWEKECQADINLSGRIQAYYYAVFYVSEEEHCASVYQEKLDKLLDIKQKYANN